MPILLIFTGASVLGFYGIYNIPINPNTYLLIIFYLLFLFHMRILDEFKDFKYDSIHHPNRPIQQGLLTLNTIRNMGIINFFLIIIISLILTTNLHNLLPLVATFIYSLLMFKEFFHPNLYETSPLLYLVSHEIIFILLFIFITTIIDNGNWTQLSSFDFLSMLYIIIPVLLLEIGRKVIHRFDETGEKTNDTYAFVWGQKNTLLILNFLILISGIINYLLSASMMQSMILLTISICLSVLTFSHRDLLLKQSQFIYFFVAILIPLILFI